jgi:thymidylate kinase
MFSKLNSGTTLVVDRYSYSGMAYTLAKNIPGIDQQVWIDYLPLKRKNYDI